MAKAVIHYNNTFSQLENCNPSIISDTTGTLVFALTNQLL